MGRAPCCDKTKVRIGPWSQEEDLKLTTFVEKHGHSNWRSLPREAGLLRCGKSCRLRWINYLRPDVKRGNFTAEEEETIINLHNSLGNKWSKIASQLPGRTDNEIKNVWNTHLKKRLRVRETSDDDRSDMYHQNTDNNSQMVQQCIDQFKNPNNDHLHRETQSSSSSSSSVAASSDHSPAPSSASESSDIDDVWELLESLDSIGSLQSSAHHLQVDGIFQDIESENSEVELHKWLTFFEDELGLTSEDQDNINYRKEM